MRVLVVEAGGQLGRRVVRALASAGHEVSATVRDEATEAEVRQLGGRPLPTDLMEATAAHRALAGSDAAVHLAAWVPPLHRLPPPQAWADVSRQRVWSSRLVAEACASEGVPVYLHQSMTFLYADGGARWLDESAPLDVTALAPLADAHEAEASAEQVTAAGGRGIVMRFAAFYAYDAFQSVALASAMQRRRYTLIGPARNFFSSIHLDDAASAILAALGAPAGIFNVGDDRPMPLRENLAALARAIDAPPMRRLPALLGPAIVGEAWRYVSRSQRISAARLRQATGWSPTVPDALAGWQRIATEWAAESG
jgi:nucleoside-diphosphate-sugar epimerase